MIAIEGTELLKKQMYQSRVYFLIGYSVRQISDTSKRY